MLTEREQAILQTIERERARAGATGDRERYIRNTEISYQRLKRKQRGEEE